MTSLQAPVFSPLPCCLAQLLGMQSSGTTLRWQALLEGAKLFVLSAALCALTC